MKQRINDVTHIIRQASKASTAEFLNTVSKIGCAARGTVVDASGIAISRISMGKKKLSYLNLRQVERIIPTTAVGYLNAAVPCLLKDLPEVAKSLANRAGGIASDELFNRIPAGVRLREGSILEFLRVHDVSHRISIKNNPAKAGDINNVVFEIASKNRARGSKNMTYTEFQNARFSNTITGIKCGFKTAVGTAAKGAIFGALLELPITCIENALHVRNNRKSMKDARADAAKDIGMSAGLAGASAAAFTGLSLLGVTLAPVAMPLVIVGGVVYTWSATDRIWKALDDATKEKLINSDPVRFLASVARYENERDGASSLKMLPG